MGMSIDEKNKFIEESKEHFKEWHDMNYIQKANYENRLKADMVAILEDLDLQIDELAAYNLEVAKVQRLIRDRINKLKGEEDGTN